MQLSVLIVTDEPLQHLKVLTEAINVSHSKGRPLRLESCFTKASYFSVGDSFHSWGNVQQTAFIVGVTCNRQLS